ncbi:MAG: hypothetical protein WCP85_01425 [Mariniphaga sp.]
MKTTNDEIKTNEDPKGKKMTRKAAINKAGFIAISAATTMMLLATPKAAHASTGPQAPGSEPAGGGTWTKRTPG